MARIARLVVPGLPHHVTQRGNRGEQTFFSDDDYTLYKTLLAEAARNAGAEVWAYCLMPNHAHVVVVPQDEDGLRKTFADAHRRYTRHINARLGVTGHMWQGRFGSIAMDDGYLAHAVRYISLAPVREKLVKRADKWRWSSVAAHLAGRDDDLVTVAPVLERVGDFAHFLDQKTNDAEADAFAALRKSETSGRPLGDADFIAGLERRTGRTLQAQKRGPKPKRRN